MATTAEKDSLVSTVATLTRELHRVVEEGRKSFKSCTDINEFVLSRGADEPHGLYNIYPVSLYAQCFRSAGVATKKELEETWSRYFNDSEVRECVDELLAAEDAYRSLIKEIEAEMQHYEDATAVPVVSLGESIPGGLALTEANSGETIPVVQNVCSKANYTLFVLRKHFI